MANTPYPVNTQEHQISSYNSVAKFLHWLIALAIIGMLALGWVMGDKEMFPLNIRMELFQWHKSIGFTILVLSLLRLIWRLLHIAPALPAAMPQWEKFAAKATHWVFYALIIAMPFSGWVMISASAYKSEFFWLFEIPKLPYFADLPQPNEIKEQAEHVHGFLAYVILVLLLLHVGAALKHHFISKDDVLLRMAPKFAVNALNRLRGRK